MHRSPSLPSAAAIPAPDFPRELLTRGPPAGSGRVPEGSGAAEVIRYLTEDHDRIAQRMNDVVIRRIFGAGLDLQVVLALIGDHSGASKIYHALDELDQAIRDIRDTIFDRNHPVHHASLTKTHDGPPCTPTLARAVPMNSRQRRGSSHSWGADGVSCPVLPEGLDAGDREPGELSRAGLLRRVGPPNGHARRGRHRAEDPLLLWVTVLPDARSAARRRAFHRAGRLPSRWPSAPPRTPGHCRGVLRESLSSCRCGHALRQP
jgi:hypothetical protein